MMFDVVAIGELLIDFTPYGATAEGSKLFAQNPGGAPANVLACNSKLGGKAAFIGKVGKDDFGYYLKEALDNIGIDTGNLVFSDEAHTTLAFVHLDSSGDRSFSFFRKPGADILLKESELDKSLLSNTRILHFGSLSLIDAPCRAATWEAVKTARKAGAVISFDPNYRAPLWESEIQAVKQMKAGLAEADIVKLSEGELAMLTGTSDLPEGAGIIRQYGVLFVLVTLGKRGVYYQIGNYSGILPTYSAKTIDTNGAGDAFTGAVHYCLRGKSKSDILSLPKAGIEDILDFANAVGAIVTGKNGAIPAMPTLHEVNDYRKTVSHLII